MKKVLCGLCSVFFLVALFSIHAVAQTNNIPMRISINAGVSLPQGDFGSTSGKTAGYATTGFCVALEGTKSLDEYANWVTSANLSINSIDEGTLSSQTGNSISADRYTTTWLMTGLGFDAPVSPAVNFYMVGQLGLLISNFPDITFSANRYSVTQTTKTATALGLGFCAGIKFEKVNLGMRYYYGEPEYEETATSGSYTETAKAKLSATVLQIMLGIYF